VSAATAKQQESTTVKLTRQLAADRQSASVCVVNSQSSTGLRQCQSPQSDNSFDAEYCDVEPDSSCGSINDDDIADLSPCVTVTTTAVTGCTNNSLSCGPSVVMQPAVTTTEAIVTSDATLSNTRADLPKSSIALMWDKLPCSPVKYNTDIFSPVLPRAPLPADSLTDYIAPVMAAESSTPGFRFLPATAAALCDTSTVSSPSFARSLCAAMSVTAKRPQPQQTAGDTGAVDRHVSVVPQHSNVVSSSTPVMADVLQAQLDQASIHQLSAAGLPAVRTARLTDQTELLNALLSQTPTLGIQKPEALAGSMARQQVLANDVTVPVIAFLNLGAGALPSFSCAAIIPPGSLQFLKMSISNDSISSSHTAGIVSSSDQAKLL